MLVCRHVGREHKQDELKQPWDDVACGRGVEEEEAEHGWIEMAVGVNLVNLV